MRKIIATTALKPRVASVRYVAWLYAAIIAVMAVGQLFAFEDFIPLIGSYALLGGQDVDTVVATLIVFVEVFSLPFLLGMTLSPLMRWFSLVCGLAVAGAWVKLSLLAVWTNTTLENSGLLGSKVDIPTGWSAVAISFGLLALSIVCIWGLWPLARKK